MDMNGIGAGALDQYSIGNKPTGSSELGKNEFMTLLVAQMNNQNPLEPQSNGEMIAQLAQFSSVEGIDKLNNSMDNFVTSMQSTQALQASTMVGRTVMMGMENAVLDEGESIDGIVVVPSSTSDLMINIYDDAGQLVAQRPQGIQDRGNLDFSWDGMDDDGNPLPPGKYRFEAMAMIDGESQQVPTVLPARVDSVTLGGNGMGDVILNLAGLGSAMLRDVQMIKE